MSEKRQHAGVIFLCDFGIDSNGWNCDTYSGHQHGRRRKRADQLHTLWSTSQLLQNHKRTFSLHELRAINSLIISDNVLRGKSFVILTFRHRSCCHVMSLVVLNPSFEISKASFTQVLIWLFTRKPSVLRKISDSETSGERCVSLEKSQFSKIKEAKIMRKRTWESYHIVITRIARF